VGYIELLDRAMQEPVETAAPESFFVVAAHVGRTRPIDNAIRSLSGRGPPLLLMSLICQNIHVLRQVADISPGSLDSGDFLELR
jgi:hypothetical protein